MSYRSRNISWSSVMRDVRASGPSKAEFCAAVRAENAAKSRLGVEALKAAPETRVRVGLSTSYSETASEVSARLRATRLRTAALAYATA